MGPTVPRVPMPRLNNLADQNREQIEALIQELLTRIVDEDLRTGRLESEGKIEEAHISETRGIRMELMVAQLEAILYNRPIDLVDHIQRGVFQHLRQLHAQYLMEARNQNWRLAVKTCTLMDKIRDNCERRCNIREGLIAQMGLE